MFNSGSHLMVQIQILLRQTCVCVFVVACEPHTWTSLRQGPLVIIVGLDCTPLSRVFRSLEFNDEVPLFEGSNKREMRLTRLSLIIFVCFSSRVVSVS